MIAKLNAMILAGALAAAPAFAAPAPAAATPAPAPAASPAATTTSSTGAVNTGRIAWGGIGLYDIGISVNVPGFGNVSSSSSYFGINVGGAMNIAQLAPDFPLAVWANAAIAFANGGEFFPLTAGAAVRYDKLPVQLFGGLGFTIMPSTGGNGNSVTPVGLDIQLMGLYPLPMVHPNLSADLQIAYHILNDSFSLWTFTIGGAWAF